MRRRVAKPPVHYPVRAEKGIHLAFGEREVFDWHNEQFQLHDRLKFKSDFSKKLRPLRWLLFFAFVRHPYSPAPLPLRRLGLFVPHCASLLWADPPVSDH